MKPVEPVPENIYQSNTYRKDLSWPHIDNEPSVQEKQQVKDQQSCMLITGSSGSGKTNALLNLINHGPDIDKIYLFAKDPHEAKYQLLITKRDSTGLKYFNDSKAFIEY